MGVIDDVESHVLSCYDGLVFLKFCCRFHWLSRVGKRWILFVTMLYSYFCSGVIFLFSISVWLRCFLWCGAV
jgi:hypothetical protein